MERATVVIAAWRAANTLGRAVDSALAQTGVEVEVIVVDDASGDDTLACARELAARDPRISVIALPRNAGPAAARNAGLDAARGDWIAILDADDRMIPTRLESLTAFAARRGADIVCDNLVLIDPEGRRTGLYLEGGTEARWSLAGYLEGNMVAGGRPSLGYLKPVMRAAWRRETGARYDESLRNGEDFHFMLEAIASGAQAHYAPIAGYLYTRRRGSISDRLDADHASALVEAGEAFLRRHPDIGATPRRLVGRRCARIADLAAAEAALDALRQGRPAQALRSMMARPQAISRFARQLFEAGRKRLTPK